MEELSHVGIMEMQYGKFQVSNIKIIIKSFKIIKKLTSKNVYVSSSKQLSFLNYHLTEVLGSYDPKYLSRGILYLLMHV